MDLREALKKIEAEYGTLDMSEVWDMAAVKRSRTRHEETPRSDGTSHCPTCGIVEDGAGDPVYHPEGWLTESDEVLALKVMCKLCERDCLAETAHLHQGSFVGSCCWDERLRATE